MHCQTDILCPSSIVSSTLTPITSWSGSVLFIRLSPFLLHKYDFKPCEVNVQFMRVMSVFPTEQVAICGAPLALVGESSVMVSWQSVESVIRVRVCAADGIQTHTFWSCHVKYTPVCLSIVLQSPAETILKLQEAFEITQLNLNSLK